MRIDRTTRKILQAEKQKERNEDKRHNKALKQAKQIEENRSHQEQINAMYASQQLERHHSDILRQGTLAQDQAHKQHKENMSMYERFQNNEWLRWRITTFIAVAALAISVFAFIK